MSVLGSVPSICSLIRQLAIMAMIKPQPYYIVKRSTRHYIIVLFIFLIPQTVSLLDHVDYFTGLFYDFLFIFIYFKRTMLMLWLLWHNLIDVKVKALAKVWNFKFYYTRIQTYNITLSKKKNNNNNNNI